MKKTVAVLFVIFVFTGNAFAEITLKIGADIAGDHKISGNISDYNISGKDDVETSFSLSGEYIKRVQNFEFGAGLTLMVPRSLDEYTGDFYFIPVYGLFKIRSESEKIAHYFTGHFGYSFFLGDNEYEARGISLKNDLYLAGGLGVIIGNKWQVEVLYTSNNGEIEIYGQNFEVEYKKVTLSLGITF